MKNKIPAFHLMTLNELADWVSTNNKVMFDTGDFPAVDDIDEEEQAVTKEEYESMADQIFYQKPVVN